MFIGSVLLFVALFDAIESRERVWRFHTDISSPSNWVGGKLAENCKGIHFSPVNTAPVYIHELTTPELVLPTDGEIGIMDGGWIEFKDNKKCIQLKPLDYHDWYDDESWMDNDANIAVPDKEKIPCDHDDVAFPHGIHSRVLDSVGSSIEMKSLNFDQQLMGTDDMESFMSTRVGSEIFYNPIDPLSFDIKGTGCEDPQGCLCHSDYVQCPYKKYQDKITCLDPIQPEEFCHEVCGAYITFKPKIGFKLDNLKKKLGEYSVDTYASRVIDYMRNDVIQVVFREKEFNGKSLEEAQDLLEHLKAGAYQIINPQMQQSGWFYIEGAGVGSTLSIVFGTLAAVVMFFGVLLYVNSNTKIDLIISSLNRGRGSVFNVPFFARFDNTDQNLIIDSQSVVGSVQDLAKSFDNPMYGRSSPSIDSESDSKSQHENPLYDVALKNERPEDAQE